MLGSHSRAVGYPVLIRAIVDSRHTVVAVRPEVVPQVVWTRVGGGLVSPHNLATGRRQAPPLRDSVDLWDNLSSCASLTGEAASGGCRTPPTNELILSARRLARDLQRRDTQPGRSSLQHLHRLRRLHWLPPELAVVGHQRTGSQQDMSGLPR